MKVALFANTPAQAHFIKNISKELELDGINTIILSRNSGDTLNLLNELEIKNIVYSEPRTTKWNKLFNLPLDIINASKIINKFDPELIFGFGIYESYTGLLTGKPVIIFNDSEPKANRYSYAIQFKLFMPFIQTLITPSSFTQNLGKKHIKVESYKELAYLHPKYFKPKKDIFNILGLKNNEDYAVLRFNAFSAVHDMGIKGFTDEEKIYLVKELEKYMKVFISSESGVPSIIRDRIMNIPKSRIHDVLAFAKILVTDTQTMATEAAIIGTPTIRCNKFVGLNDMGNFLELENKYSLLFNYADSKKAINKAIELVNEPMLKNNWKIKSEQIFKDKIDITNFIVIFIKNYLNK
jgi:predicted glycosyltransferase